VSRRRTGTDQEPDMTPLTHASLSSLVAIRRGGAADDFCGTPVPGRPPIPIGPSTLLERIGLNPQPLPPKEVATAGGPAFGGRAASFDDGDWCGTVPRHFPPVPPLPGPWGDLLTSVQSLAR
jgi:hypothetical protein